MRKSKKTCNMRNTNATSASRGIFLLISLHSIAMRSKTWIYGPMWNYSEHTQTTITWNRYRVFAFHFNLLPYWRAMRKKNEMKLLWRSGLVACNERSNDARKVRQAELRNGRWISRKEAKVRKCKNNGNGSRGINDDDCWLMKPECSLGELGSSENMFSVELIKASLDSILAFVLRRLLRRASERIFIILAAIDSSRSNGIELQLAASVMSVPQARSMPQR